MHENHNITWYAIALCLKHPVLSKYFFWILSAIKQKKLPG